LAAVGRSSRHSDDSSSGSSDRSGSLILKHPDLPPIVRSRR
jgi:hypothetical protein